jgi:hypothetical protein
MTAAPDRLIRVFPRTTKATPDDALAYFGPPDSKAEADEVHVSVTFTYDKAWAEYLAEQWRHVAPVKLGGVAYGDRGEDFVPGRYIKPGYVFTSRGCPRRCWFCSVWKRDPVPRLLPITNGWNILDDNLLACPRAHVEAVFAMLRRQGRRIEFTGGLEAASLQDYQVELLASLRPRPIMFFAYDPGDAFETLEHAARRLLVAGFTRASHAMRAYVLIGYPKDSFAAAEQRLQQMLRTGFTPMAMLWRPETASQMKYAPEDSWRTFQRRWARPAIIHGYMAVPARSKAARAAQRLDAKDRAQQRPGGRPKSVDNGGRDINSSRPTGTSKAAALRRLRKDRPDIHARVLAGQISAHAGMVEAGFRRSKRGAPCARAAAPPIAAHQQLRHYKSRTAFHGHQHVRRR